jgi:hypothetical protein
MGAGQHSNQNRSVTRGKQKSMTAEPELSSESAKACAKGLSEVDCRRPRDDFSKFERDSVYILLSWACAMLEVVPKVERRKVK